MQREFQSIFNPAIHAVLPTNSLVGRLAVHTGILLTQNQLAPLIEEGLFRWLLQDKILSRITPRAKTLPSRIFRIGLVAALFGAAHYGIPATLGSIKPSELVQISRFTALHTMGCGIVYGMAYEKLGFSGAVAAHSAWNFFYDVWRFNTWQAISNH